MESFLLGLQYISTKTGQRELTVSTFDGMVFVYTGKNDGMSREDVKYLRSIGWWTESEEEWGWGPIQPAEKS